MPDIVSGYTWQDGEKGVTAGKMNGQFSGAVIQPDFVTAKPSSSTLDPTDQLLEVKGAGTYARITGSQLISSVSAQVDATPQIYSVRLRSFNSLSNPNFEVDTVNCNVAINNAPTGVRIADRWFLGKGGTMGVTTYAGNNNQVVIPGTSYVITGSQATLQLTTQQTTLGANDFLTFQQSVEGPAWRELRGDVHSMSLLVYSTVAPLTFAVALRDTPITKSFVKTVTLSTANTWTLLTLPNLPVFPSGNFSQNPGAVGYTIAIALASGSTLLTPSPGAWASGNYIGASGMTNWCANPISTTQFFCAFVQHEPGSQSSQLMDVPFTQNLAACQRYLSQSYDYGIKAGAVNTNGAINLMVPANAHPLTWVGFPQRMAKAPTVVGYSPATGAANTIRDGTASVDRAISSAATGIGQGGFSGFFLTTPNTGVSIQQFHYTADTSW